MPTFTPVTTETVKTVCQHDPVRVALAELPDYARNAGYAYDMIGRALRWFGWDFANRGDPTDFEASDGCVEIELSTMFGDGVAGVLYMQWNSNSRRAGEITFSAFIN